MNKGFLSTMRKGFHMTFENGLSVSVQWGAGNYCDNHFPKDMDFSFSKDAESSTAEVAIFDKAMNFMDTYQFVDDSASTDGEVIGYLTPSQVVDILVKVRDYPNN